jgi:Vitamin B12 dependent methionine synthase, activation domain
VSEHSRKRLSLPSTAGRQITPEAPPGRGQIPVASGRPIGQPSDRRRRVRSGRDANSRSTHVVVALGANLPAGARDRSLGGIVSGWRCAASRLRTKSAYLSPTAWPPSASAAFPSFVHPEGYAALSRLHDPRLFLIPPCSGSKWSGPDSTRRPTSEIQTDCSSSVLSPRSSPIASRSGSLRSDQSEKGTLWRLLDVEKNTGMLITESFAMWPGSSVRTSRRAPRSRYFTLSTIDRDQADDYAARRGMTHRRGRALARPNLNYDPATERLESGHSPISQSRPR